MNKLPALFITLAAFNAHAAITVSDDDGRTVMLQKPAARVIAMAPHVTEMLYAAGGAARIIAAVDYADYPEQAKLLPRVGSNRQIDMERVAALKPDLIVVWLHGSSERQIEQIRALGIPMYHSEPKKLDDIASSLQRLGKLMGTEAVAEPAATSIRQKLASLAARYANRPPVRTFYQVWDKPLYTLNGGHIVSDAIRLCGGDNVFGKLYVKAPEVSIEAVMQEDPEVIFGGDQHDPADAGLNIWKPFKGMQAVKRGNLFNLGGELLTRPTPRMADGATNLCEKLELARQRRR